jgi:TonB family protein
MKIAAIASLLLCVSCASSQRTSLHGELNQAFLSRVELSVVGESGTADTPPIPKAKIAIYYPLEMYRAGITGEVIATATIEKNGRVSDVSIDHASQVEFTQPVICGLPKCTFSPAIKSGHAIRAVVHCQIKFILDEA